MNYGYGFYEAVRMWLAPILTHPAVKLTAPLVAVPDLRLYRMRLYNSRDGPMR